MNFPIGSSARSLTVLHLILKHGPISTLDLVKKTNLPRTALHRAIHSLIQIGAIRYLLGKRELVLTNQWMFAAQTAQASPLILDKAFEEIHAFLTQEKLTLEIVIAAPGRRLIRQETNSRLLTTPQEVDPLLSEFAYAYFTKLPRSEIVLWIQDILKKRPLEDQNFVTSGQFYQSYNAILEDEGNVWSPDRSHLSFGFTDEEGTTGAFRLHGTSAHCPSEAVLLSYKAQLLKLLDISP